MSEIQTSDNIVTTISEKLIEKKLKFRYLCANKGFADAVDSCQRRNEVYWLWWIYDFLIRKIWNLTR